MVLTPMRYKTFTWPHNPRIYEIEFKRSVVQQKVPFGRHILQDLGLEKRILKGEGEFAGTGAYSKFKELASLFYDNTPGALVHPVWQLSNVWFVALALREEPREDYVSYTFEFWDCFDGYETGATLLTEEESGTDPGNGMWYTVVSGDCLWNIATRYGMTLSALLALNTQIKNPNLIYPGDQIRIA